MLKFRSESSNHGRYFRICCWRLSNSVTFGAMASHFERKLARHFTPPKDSYLPDRFAQIDRQLSQRDPDFARDGVAMKLFLTSLDFQHSFQRSQRRHTSPARDLQTDAGFAQRECQDSIGCG